MSTKGTIPKSETVYLLSTIDGKEHQVTEKNYDELKPLITKGEMYGAMVVNENTDQELVVAMKHIVSISKEVRTTSKDL